jgi:uncharacterized protein YqgC (DUF456 family)
VWSIAAAVVMVVGLCGVVVPVVPGLLLMWATGLVYGFAVGWSGLGIGVMALMTVLVAISLALGVAVPRKTAAEAGASGWSQLGGLAGAVIGFFVIPVVGVIVGALVGVYLVELALKEDGAEAWTATKGMAKGFGISVLIDLTLGLVMLAAWSIWAATVLF